MLGRLAEKLRGRYRRLDERDIERAIEIAVGETDPRLRLVTGYRRRLRQPIVRSLAWVSQLVIRIPGPFEISRRTWGSDPQVNALFGSADDIDTLFSRSEPVREYFRENPGSDRVCLPLVMYRSEKKIMGMSLAGDIVRRDVAQTAVNYSGHWLGICASGEDELRRMLIWRGIHNLALVALENITRMKTATGALQEQRTLLQMKLRDLQTQHRGLEVPGTTDTGNAAGQQEVGKHLEETERKLAGTSLAPDTLDDYLQQLCTVFNHPSRYLQVKKNAVRVNRMGVKSEGAAAGQGAEVVSATITIGSRDPFEGVLVSFQRSELGEKPALF